MPVSTSVHLAHAISLIAQTAPRSILDVGCGFGVWGFLCREYLDVMNGRIRPEQWQTRIDGIELFEPYIMDHQRFLYDSIRIADIRTAVKDLPEYDVIIAGDVIEHLDKEEGEAVLDALYARARLALLVNLPLGPGWEHPETNDNPGELHRSEWVCEDMLPYPHAFKSFTLTNSAYGVFYCPKDVSIGQRIESLLAAARHQEEAGRAARTEQCLRVAHGLDTAHTEAASFLADFLMRDSRMEEAAAVLAETCEAAPGFAAGGCILAQIHGLLGRHVEALACLDRIESRAEGLAPEQLARIEDLRKTLSAKAASKDG